MSSLTYWSCVRFLVYLLAAETAMVFFQPRRDGFAFRLVSGMALLFGAAFGIFSFLKRIPGEPLAVEVLYYFALFGITLLMMRFCFDISEKELLFAGVGGYGLEHLAFGLLQIGEYLAGIENGASDRRLPVILWHYVLLYAALPIIVYWFAIRRSRKDGELKEKDIRMVLLAFATLFLTIVVSLLTRRGTAADVPYFQDFICNIYSSLCCILVLFLLFYIPKENKLRHEREMLEQVVKVMGEQQQMSRESVEIINRKCHDIKHQLRALETMEDSGERRRYTEQIKNAISIYDAVYQTGNAALDFVLREKALLCQEYEVKFSCIADGKLLDFMDTLDIYALFGNALDNALESVIKESDPEKRLINMRVAHRQEILHIHVDNYCSSEIRFEGGLPLTSKGDQAYHGFGVKSICHIAEKYDGDAVVKKQQDRFILDLLIPIPGDEIV
ncbi:MAG: ATP-binding protein [Lachnoclostridium edouardi]|uniref:ATP-binding protein n=1 Tax=Lachnoclostridium edouardi TaxID=1926283 RepID=UPI0026DB7438|nr:ATP-binding protein [Lachnoclostridium edouardi]MDO4278638.1 ATP-binding protein [Lachnoclostridium edouardi]